MEIVKRFRKGIHQNCPCGTNDSPYAMQSSYENLNVHCMETYDFAFPTSIRRYDDKKRCQNNEVILYVISILFTPVKDLQLAVVIFTRPTSLTCIILDFFRGLSRLGCIVLVVCHISGLVNLFHAYSGDESSIEGTDVAMVLCKSIGLFEERFVRIFLYPKLTCNWLEFLDAFEEVL